jgi:hypothetical protein
MIAPTPACTAARFAFRAMLWAAEDLAAEAQRAHADAQQRGADADTLTYTAERIATLARIARSLRATMSKEGLE